jgi:hypothetical protein
MITKDIFYYRKGDLCTFYIFNNMLPPWHVFYDAGVRLEVERGREEHIRKPRKGGTVEKFPHISGIFP